MLCDFDYSPDFGIAYTIRNIGTFFSAFGPLNTAL